MWLNPQHLKQRRILRSSLTWQEAQPTNNFPADMILWNVRESTSNLAPNFSSNRGLVLPLKTCATLIYVHPVISSGFWSFNTLTRSTALKFSQKPNTRIRGRFRPGVVTAKSSPSWESASAFSLSRSADDGHSTTTPPFLVSNRKSCSSMVLAWP